MKCEGINTMQRVVEGYSSDCSRGTEDSEANVASTSNIKNGLNDIAAWGHIDNDDLHVGFHRLGHQEKGGLGLVLGAHGPTTWLLGGWVCKGEIL